MIRTLTQAGQQPTSYQAYAVHSKSAASSMRASCGPTASVLATVPQAAAHKSSAPAATSLSTSAHAALRLTRSSHHMTATTRPMGPSSPTLSLFHQPRLVCVGKLAASSWPRRCVMAHKPAHTPRPLRPPLLLSLIAG